jgi:hypothetical protein
VTPDKLMETFNRRYLGIAGYTEQEIAGMGDLSKLSSQQLQELVKQKSMLSLGLNGNSKQPTPKDYLPQRAIAWKHLFCPFFQLCEVNLVDLDCDVFFFGQMVELGQNFEASSPVRKR